MTAYMTISPVRDAKDRGALERYRSAAGKIRASTGKALVPCTPFDMLEGGDVPVRGLVLPQSRLMQRAKGWHSGPEYQGVKKRREDARDNIARVDESCFVPAAVRQPSAGFVPPARPATPAL